MGVKFGMERGLSVPSPCQISPPSVQRVPLRGEKPQNWPLSKLNTGRFALRAMLPVMITKDPTWVMDAATLPRETFMSENKRRSETATVNNDKLQGSVEAYLEYGGISN